MTNIDQIINTAPDALREALNAQREEIAQAMMEVVEDGQEQDCAAVVNVPFAIRIDCDKNGVTYRLTLTRKSKWEKAQPFDDPKQGKLPGVEVEE